MKALTLWQPWSWAIAHAGKRVENRTWAPPASVIGQRIAIHAGKKLDVGAHNSLIAHDVACPADYEDGYVRGAVESVATIHGYVICEEGHAKAHGKADCRIVHNMWFTGPIGWVLTDVVALPAPVPCRGAQGLWTLPADVESAVLSQVAGVTP